MIIPELKNIIIKDLHTSCRSKKYLIFYADKNFEVSETIVCLIGSLKRSMTFGDALEDFCMRQNKRFSPEEFNLLIDQFIKPIIDSKQQKRKKTFIFQKELLGSIRLSPITVRLKVLFKPILFFSLFSIALLAQVVFFLYKTSVASNHSIEICEGLFVAFLFFVSTIFHEIGHASACRYFNIGHGAIGMGIYALFPVFYADVSEAWKLKRGERVIVDVGGIYFQLLFLLPFIGYSIVCQSITINYFIIGVDMSILLNLNPFFKFDGYWICSDLLGVPNLRARVNETTYYLYKRCVGQSISTKPYLLEINHTERVVMILYYLATNAFFVYFFLYRIPLFLISSVTFFPKAFNGLINGIAGRDDFSMQLLFSLAFQLFFIYLILRQLFVLLKRLKHRL